MVSIKKSLISSLNKYLEIFSHIKIKKYMPIKMPEGGQNNLIIEFLGPSAVGKTTLRKAFTKRYKKRYDNEVITQEELYRAYRKAEHLNFRIDPFYDKLYFQNIRTALDSTNSLLGLKQKITLNNEYLSLDLIMDNYYKDKIFIMDYYIFQIFNFELNKIVKQEKRHDFLENRVFVNCEAPPGDVVKHIWKRYKETGRLTKYHDVESKSQLFERVNKSVLNNKENAERLKKNGAFVIDIKTTNDINDNCRKISESINDFLPLA